MKQCKYPECEKPAAANGYCSNHYKRWKRGTLPDPHTPKPGDIDGFGRYGYLDGDHDHVICHECGKALRTLAWHVYQEHELRARDYKIKHGLPLGKPLDAPSMTAIRSEKSRARLGGDDWKRFEEHRDPTAASHSRDEEAFQRRGVQVEPHAKRARAHIAGQRKRAHDKPCKVCGDQVAYAGVATCCDDCAQVYRYRRSRQGVIAARIIALRDKGLSWAAAGAQLGITGQAAGARVRVFNRHLSRVRAIRERVPGVEIMDYEAGI